MKLPDLRTNIQTRRANNETYGSIAISLGINRSMVKYIETHESYRPSRRITNILNLDPCPDLIYTRSRRERLDEIAKAWGYTCWSAYETLTLREANHGGH